MCLEGAQHGEPHIRRGGKELRVEVRMREVPGGESPEHNEYMSCNAVSI